MSNAHALSPAEETIELLAETAYEAFWEVREVGPRKNYWPDLLPAEKLPWRHMVNRVMAVYMFAVFADLVPQLVRGAEFEQEMSLWTSGPGRGLTFTGQGALDE